MANSSVAAVVVTYNRKEFLVHCLGFLLNQTISVAKIFVIDNASTDGTYDLLEEKGFIESDKISYRKLNANLGGAGGFNRGVKEAFLEGHDYIWLMDDDVFPNETALEELMNASKELNGEYGFLASSVKGNSGKAMNVPIIDKSTNKDTGYPSWCDNIDVGVKITSATFVSVLFNRDIVAQIGLPIGDFFIWGDDIEYTFRAQKFQPGYFVKESVVIHKRSIEKQPGLKEETNKRRIEMQYYAIRNEYYNIKVMYSGWEKGLKKIKLIGRSFIHSFTAKKLKWLKIKTVFKGLYAGLIFKPKIETFSK